MSMGGEVGAAALSQARQAIEALEPALRRALAQAWLRAARFEHASIASFARFSLQLLAVGAPPELVVEAHEAALDEVRHARLCFGLASLYAGRACGPGPLPIDARALEALDLASVTLATVIEGCIGETLAVAQAEASREAAQLAAVREVLAVIVRDESRHADLAYRFVAWAVAVGGAPLQMQVRAAFEHEIARWRETDGDGDSAADARCEAHGRLSHARRRDVRLRTLEGVILPAMNALLA